MLIFETHATSIDNEAGLASGWFDAGLSSAGERQARELGERHQHADIACVYCSDLIRAVRTAEIAFGDRADLPVIRDARLRECDYGALTRRPAAEIEARRGRQITEPFPDGESYQQCVARVAAWLEEARPSRVDGTVLIIGHRATFYALEHLLRGVRLEDVIRAPWAWRAGWTYP